MQQFYFETFYRHLLIEATISLLKSELLMENWSVCRSIDYPLHVIKFFWVGNKLHPNICMFATLTVYTMH